MRMNPKDRLKQAAFSAIKHLPPNTAVNIIWASTLPRDLLVRRRHRTALDTERGKAEIDEEYYRQSMPHGSDGETNAKNKPRYEAIKGHITGRVIEVGCADGYFSRMFAKEGHTTFGVDLSHHFIRLAKAKAAGEGLHNVKFKVANAEHIPAKGESFDTAFLGEILEHVENPARVVQEATRVVKPGGTFIITLPTHLMSEPSHIRTVKPKALEKMLREVADIKEIRLIDFTHYLCIAKRR
ncbi:Putative arsenite methyltransferase [uncultured archaeon]|nr:Putative arsenite methyltransferase [uncultured archaeon]